MAGKKQEESGANSFLAGVSHKLGELGTAALRQLPAEAAHNLGLKLLSQGIIERIPQPTPPVVEVDLRTSLFGQQLAHPVGLAAGFDKNAVAYGGFAHLGLSFIEIGTLTPVGQLGNPTPRMFRQKEQMGLINRMGFNNVGCEAALKNLRNFGAARDSCPLGINIGKNKDTPLDLASRDYESCYKVMKGAGHYYVINISSPNTPGLRKLASREFLRELVATPIGEEKDKFWIKLDPDLEPSHLQGLIEEIESLGLAGVILTNTHRVEWPQTGGQSGHPISAISTKALEYAYEVHQGRLAMIGSGGVLSGVDVLEKIIRGASAVQIYSALVYRGMWAVFDLLEELGQEMKLRGFDNIEEAKGSFYAR